MRIYLQAAWYPMAHQSVLCDGLRAEVATVGAVDNRFGLPWG
ncbi:MAG TPA: hypothetical protein VLB86_06950 [Gaiellaceae bacterium]|nr:hypothetical protein [Gaiellaceae bacterium]